MKTRNPLTLWIFEFQENQPDAKPLDGWRCLTQTAAAFGLMHWLTGYDAERQEVIYRPAPWKAERRIGLETFRRQFSRAGRNS